MTKRDGSQTGKTAHFDLYGNGSRRSPSNCRYESLEGDMRSNSPSKNNPTHRSSLGGCNEGNFNVYRDSRSAPNSVPGSAAGSRANSRPGSRPGSRLQSRCNSQESIIDLFDSMTLKYGQTLIDGTGPIEFKTPKPKRLVNTKMSYIDRVRINSAVWRSWHMQYVKQKRSAVCHFSSPLPETSTRLVSDVIQGKTALTGYKPEELGVVVRNYNKWRTFSKDILTHRPLAAHPTLSETPEDHAIDLDAAHPPLSPGTGGKLVNDDLFKDFADTLFISRKKKHFTVPAPKKVTHMINYIPEYLQPDLSTLLPEVDDSFMAAISSFEEILAKTPVKSDPRHLGLGDEVPNTLFFNPDNPDHLNSLMDVEMEPQVVHPTSPVQHQTFPNFPYDQSPATPQKSVSFSAPTTPGDSSSSSPGYQLPSPYNYPGPSHGFQHDNQQHPHTSHHSLGLQQGHVSSFSNSFHGATEVHSQGVGNTLVQQHPVLLQTLRDAPTLPQTSSNTINTHSTMRSDARSPASSTPSPSAPKTPETKMEPASPSSSGCMGGTSSVAAMPTSNTITVGNFTYHLGDPSSNLLANLQPQGWPSDKHKEIPWNTLTTTSGGNQGFEDLGNQLVTIMDTMGHHTISVRDSQIIGSSRVALFPSQASGGGEEELPMDYCQVQPLPPLPSGGFRQPADVSMSSGVRSPGGTKRYSTGQNSASQFDVLLKRKSSGGLDHAMQSPRDERETHPRSIPSSSHASNASSAASSPGNDDVIEYNSSKRKKDLYEDKDDRALRRKRKHLDSEHKRRNNIQNCLEELQRVIPNMNVGNSSRDQTKISTAVLLQRAQEYIHSLQHQMKTFTDEEEQLKRKIETLNDEIEQCQDALPDTGAPVNSQNDTQLYQMLDEYIDEEMEKNWKFWLFSKFARPLFSSFLSALKLSTGASIAADLTKWVEESCRLRQLRPLALNPVKQISKETSVLSDPSNLPEQVQEIARRESVARKNTPPPDL